MSWASSVLRLPSSVFRPSLIGCLSPLVAGATLIAPISAQSLPLQSSAEQIVAKVGGDWGVVARSLDSGRKLIEINPEQALIPASNNKIFTTIWALDALGPDYRFPTDLLITGAVTNGVLKGDVVLRGSGDPAFGYPEYEENPLDPLRRMAQRLKELGVREVRGRVMGDASVFDTVLVGPGWPGDTGGGSAHYAPGVTGLPFQRNVVTIRVKPGSGGGPAVVELEPPVEVVPVVSTARTGGGRAWAVRPPGKDTIQVKGAVSGRRAHIYKVGVSEPALMTADALRQALIEQGITVTGGVALGAAPENARLVHRHLSIPLSAMTRQLNRKSDNFFAEHFWKAAAAKATGKGSFATAGAASALHFHQVAHVPFGQLYQFDGSGLSSHNRASAEAMVRALEYAHRAPYSRVFHESLAVAGDSDGTLQRLFRGGRAEGNLHAKTGYIDNVRTLSGYVRAANGELIAFSFLFNGRGTSAARGAQTELGNLLADWGPGEAAAAAKEDS